MSLQRLHGTIRALVYIGSGSMICLPLYFSVPTWWGWGTVILVVASLLFYVTVERPNKKARNSALLFGIGVNLDTAAAWLEGRLYEETYADLLLAGSVALVIVALLSDKGK